jgi:hypothetical protein
MPIRPLLWLAQPLLALLLLAGVPAAADGSLTVRELTQLHHQDRPDQTLLPDNRGGRSGLAADLAWLDVDDDSEPFALVPTLPQVDRAASALAFLGFACAGTAPTSHWPCANPSTGPPRR